MAVKHQITLGDIVKRAGVKYEGDLSLVITGVNGLADATATEISFLDNMHYRNQLPTTKAAAVLLKPALT
ncbi:MAG: UDP-3-O-(3-hydroxymyristoyl)glucosamine N-acyltransferase, partial [Gammaproteobacteria bacterium]|nr:UDP-3-O-(3-hydroxymyristoyl)glucosamine N-acyltransferase [Gammaproteobacteria bacterium]